MRLFPLSAFFVAMLGGCAAASHQVTFDTNFEGGSLGRVERLSDTEFRCHVEGQEDERGRNRQASWYYFRLDHLDDTRAIKLTLTDLVGEYNDRPGAVPAGPDILPVYSENGRTWRHVDRGQWDDGKKEMIITLHPRGRTLWIAHVPPYTPADLDRLLADVRRHPHALVEVIGKSVQGRDLHMVTITEPQTPDAAKRSLFLMSRQHAWEAGTSYVAEGAIRFLVSDDPSAAQLRRDNIFRFIPMVDVDGCATGKVRFNANGYDVNRHWDQVDLRRPEFLRKMPEIWYAKKAIVEAAAPATGGRRGGIDLLVNLHNTETAEYLETHAKEQRALAAIRRLSEQLVSQTTFDPSRELTVRDERTGTTNALSREYAIPVVLMEQRIATSKKLGRRPTVEDRLNFGRELIIAIAQAVH
jgi:Zinc carboxypeptidase/Cytosolic carboxypeptidase N-terminal domain